MADCIDLDESSQSSSTGPRTSGVQREIKKLTLKDNMKFMENFDPERSNRERRKLTRKINSGGGRKQAEEKTGTSTVEKNICDCLDESCPGCHFPCPKCRSCKCGVDCRQVRKYTIESIEVEGTGMMIKNPYR